jgi:hypothetical protein
MGATKRLLEENQALDDWADGLLLEHEAISECPIHEDVLLDNLDPGAAEEAAAEARRSPPDGLTPDAAGKLVTERLNSIGEECGWCAKNRDS